MNIVVMSLVSLLCLITNVLSEEAYFKTIEVDGNKNCAKYGTNKWNDKTIKETLPPGKYKFVPMDGAISVWAKDSIALDIGENPWSWYLVISVEGDRYELGSLAKFKTPKVALSEQKDDNVVIVLEKETIIQLGVEDIYKEKDYCSDNRGKETVGIIKMN